MQCKREPRNGRVTCDVEAACGESSGESHTTDLPPGSQIARAILLRLYKRVRSKRIDK